MVLKGNDHNEFRLHENTSRCLGRFLLQPRRDVRQVSTCRRVSLRQFPQSASARAASYCFFTAMSVDSVKKIFNDNVKELNDASSHRSLFLDNERYKNILQEVKEAQMLRKNNQPLKKHYRCLKRNDVMKIGDTQVLTESGSGENDDSNIRYYCKTEELFDVLETVHVNIRQKRTTGKRHCFVCDSQKHSLYLFLSTFLFVSFSHGS